MIIKKLHNKTIHLAFVAIVFSGIAFGQGSEEKKPTPVNGANANTQVVDARQSGAWIVGLDPARNTVQLAYGDTNPLAVKVTSNRKPFQVRIIVTPSGLGNATATYPIPAGKRLVIENISAVGRVPAGLKMEMNFFVYCDNDGDGVIDPEDLVFNRVALIDQGTFDDTTILAANHKVLVFADGTIGSSNLSISLIARLNAATTGFAQGQLTISGYLEDLPANQ